MAAFIGIGNSVKTWNMLWMATTIKTPQQTNIQNPHKKKKNKNTQNHDSSSLFLILQFLILFLLQNIELLNVNQNIWSKQSRT